LNIDTSLNVTLDDLSTAMPPRSGEVSAPPEPLSPPRESAASSLSTREDEQSQKLDREEPAAESFELPQSAGIKGEPEEEIELPPAPGEKPHHVKVPIELGDDDIVYMHAVTVVPLDEKPDPRPLMLEEKGIDNREFAFALDRGGLRFFLSRFDRRSMSISKSGVLLLGKQESLRLRGVHAGIINDLRAHGVLLPFRFGTVAVDKADLFEKIDEHLFDLQDAVEDLLATTRWTVSVSMLDRKLAQIIGSEGGGVRRERDRRETTGRGSSQGGKVDIKTLERILGRQKKIAESIHAELDALADRSTIESIVGFSSGTSDEWKLILKAWYEVPPSRVQRLNRAITDIQYRHFLFELMLSLTGDQTEFDFPKTSQA
jgi:hypothetical protein